MHVFTWARERVHRGRGVNLSFRGSLVCLVALACILRAGMCLSTYLRAVVARVVTYVGQREVYKHVPAHVVRTRGLFRCCTAKEALPTRANACLAPFHPRLFPPLTHLLTLRDGNSDRDDVHKPRGGPAEIGISCATTRIYRSTYYIRWIDQVCARREQYSEMNERSAEVRWCIYSVYNGVLNYFMLSLWTLKVWENFIVLKWHKLLVIMWKK